MGRFARSWDLTKASMRVVRQDKHLLWMPVLSGLATVIAVLLVAGVGIFAHVAPQVTMPDGTVNLAGLLLALGMYILLAFVSLFFNAAVVAAATERLNGGTPTAGSGLRAASRKLGKIFAWAVIVGTVNLVLQFLREQNSRNRNIVGQIVGSILISLGATAWNLCTAFMVPVLLFEDKRIGDSMRSSVNIVKRTWGEYVIGNVGLSLVGTVVGFVVLLTGVLLAVTVAPYGVAALVTVVAIVVLALLAVMALFSVLGGVYRAALYRYATTGQAGGGFTADQLNAAFTVKASRPYP